MKAEVITIGEELLSGQTLDTNSAFVGRTLADVGIEVVWKTSVGDRVEDIKTAIQTAWDRSQVTVCTGGLGPTVDDITKKAICAAFGRKLVLHDEITEMLQQRYAERGRKMPALVQNQALQPQGAEFIENNVGSALGIVFRESDRYLVSLPGVPAEMKPMLERGVLPQLRRLPGRKFIEMLRLRTVGITEAEITEIISDLQPKSDNLKLAYLPSYRGVDLRVTGIFDSEEVAKREVEILADTIRGKIGDYVYTVGDHSLAEVVGTLLKQRSKTLSTAESCTGGLMAKTLTDIPGSSTFFVGSVVSYADEVKQALLKVPKRTLEQVGAVSKEVAIAMAENVRKLTGSDYALSTTGIAGPSGGTPEKPVGLVFVGYADDNGSRAVKLQLMGRRERIREGTALSAFDLLRRKLIEEM